MNPLHVFPPFSRHGNSGARALRPACGGHYYQLSHLLKGKAVPHPKPTGVSRLALPLLVSSDEEEEVSKNKDARIRERAGEKEEGVR